jgi:hypothetical protein
MSIIRHYKRTWVPDVVSRITVQPCANPVMVFAEAAISGIGIAATSILSPDPTGKEYYHAAFGETAICSAKGLINDMAVVEEESYLALGKRSLFLLGELYDQITWSLFLAGAAHDGLMDFVSQLYYFSRCGSQGSATYGNGPLYEGALERNGTPQTCAYYMTPGSIFYPFSASVLRVAPYQRFGIGASAQFNILHAGDDNLGCETKNTTDNLQLDGTQSKTHLGVTPNVGAASWFEGVNIQDHYINVATRWSYYSEDSAATGAIATKGACFLYYGNH